MPLSMTRCCLFEDLFPADSYSIKFYILSLLPNSNVILYDTINTMSSIADGEPKPTYDWNRNEIVFNPFGNDDRIVQLSDAGTLFINMPEDKDEGIFQCFAKNDFGKSASKKINLKQAKMASFAFARPTYHTPSLGRPYTLPCVPPESVPPPNVFWITKTAQGGFNVVNYDSRVSMDREYSLRITNVVETDANQGLPYACMAMNNVVRSHVEGPLHFLAPTGDTEVTLSVAYLWSDSEDIVGFLGTSVSLKCMFSANPSPDVHWERADNRTMSYRVLTTYTPLEILIMNLQFEDEGVYICWASNSLSDRPLNHQIHLTVHAKPYFVLEPKDINSGIGATIEICCNASGVPEPTFEWLVDGVSLKAEAPVILTPAGTVTEISEENDVMIVCEVTASTTFGLLQNYDATDSNKIHNVIKWFPSHPECCLGRRGQLHLPGRKRAQSDTCQFDSCCVAQATHGQAPIRPSSHCWNLCYLHLFRNDSNRSVKILWKKEHSYITEYDLGLVSYNDSLFIVHASGRDSGLYTCVAMNGLANITASASLLVR
ncbi:neuroglian-like isoform X4, partial [Biomphalaria pfeifferi]